MGKGPAETMERFFIETIEGPKSPGADGAASFDKLITCERATRRVEKNRRTEAACDGIGWTEPVASWLESLHAEGSP